MNEVNRAAIATAAEYIRSRVGADARIALILGSGLNVLAERAEGARAIPYEEIPHFPRSTVPGHAGRLVAGRLAGAPVLIMQGRVHYYEGYSLAEVTFPTRVLRALGVEILLVTNAAGGLNPTGGPGTHGHHRPYQPGGDGGAHPLAGPNDETLGPRFPSMVRAYDPPWWRAWHRWPPSAASPSARECTRSRASFETPARCACCGRWGPTRWGCPPRRRSPSPGTGMRVLGLSLITNVAITQDDPNEPTHEEVVAVGQRPSHHGVPDRRGAATSGLALSQTGLDTCERPERAHRTRRPTRPLALCSLRGDPVVRALVHPGAAGSRDHDVPVEKEIAVRRGPGDQGGHDAGRGGARHGAQVLCPADGGPLGVRRAAPTHTPDPSVVAMVRRFRPRRRRPSRPGGFPPPQATPTQAPTPTPDEPTATPPPPPAPCPDPNVRITSPGMNAGVSGWVGIHGTANHAQFQFYTVEYGIGENPGNWNTIGVVQHSAVVGGQLTGIDTRMLPNGTAWFRLTVVDQTGNFPPPCSVRVVIQN